ncbi:uncharacterized protein N7473_011117 [Penicillium subrubescens]|uniref:uncharacterized protein n=1 Tax=Penicillium subrubescens TaxID=1316194 RepID=UPI002544F144|nr:uncharacterized protein N7473_011117 [Penicillium subrubescens]KAJ5882683.1 hypothetical protein N7473_011117 [Penicillium subrubescens]
MPRCLSKLFRLTRRHTKPSVNASQEYHNDQGDSDSLPPPYPRSHTEAITSGIETLCSPLKSNIDVVFLLDPAAEPATTWRAEGTLDPWPKTLLPCLFPTARILAFTYEKYTLDWKKEDLQDFIRNRARNFLSLLSIYREKDSTTERPITFICHGLGGLVCTDALLISSTHLEPAFCNISLSAHGVVFLGTPFTKSGLAAWLQSVSGSAGLDKQGCFHNVDFIGQGTDQMHDQIIADLGRVIEKRDERLLPPIDVTCFFNKGSSLELNSFMGEDSATLPRFPSVGIHANYEDMTKIVDAGDPLFQAICDKLCQWVLDVYPNARHPRNPSSAVNPGACQNGNGNRQYNHLGPGTQKNVEGHCFETCGDQNFLVV